MNRPNGKYCAAPGSFFPSCLWPECYLPSTSVGGRTRLCHSARGQPFCFSTQCMFSALVSSDAWMIRQTVKTLPASVSVRTSRKSRSNSNGVRETGAVVPGKHQEGGLHQDPTEDRLPYFISRGGYIELNFMLLWMEEGGRGEGMDWAWRGILGSVTFF